MITMFWFVDRSGRLPARLTAVFSQPLIDFDGVAYLHYQDDDDPTIEVRYRLTESQLAEHCLPTSAGTIYLIAPEHYEPTLQALATGLYDHVDTKRDIMVYRNCLDIQLMDNANQLAAIEATRELLFNLLDPAGHYDEASRCFKLRGGFPTPTGFPDQTYSGTSQQRRQAMAQHPASQELFLKREL